VLASPQTADRRTTREAIAQYERSLADVPGWLDYADFLVLQLIDEIQDGLGFVGDILEIGAYQGRTAILLQYFCRGDDRLSVCDVFEQRTGDDENERERDAFYTDLTRETFEQYFLRYHPKLPDVHQCRSQDLGSRLSARSFRLIHVDGAHLHAVVRSDLALAKRVAAPGGIVAVDDYRREHTPGVAAAAWEAVLNGGLVPLCITPGKLYGCWQHADWYTERLRELARNLPALRMEEHVILERAVLRLSDASVQGASREEFIAVQLAELQRAHAAHVEAADADSARAERELAQRAADLETARERLETTRDELETVQRDLAAALRDAALARREIADMAIALAQHGMRIEDLELRIRLLEGALGIAPR